MISTPDPRSVEAPMSKMVPPIALIGVLSALGAIGLVATNILYAIALARSPAVAHPLDLSDAMSGTLASAGMLKAAGAVGIIGDIIWATAALLMAQEFGRRGRIIVSAGWNALVLAIILFVFVDGLTGFVLPQLAVTHNMSAFDGFRHFWDVIFLLCSLCFGAATIPRRWLSALRCTRPIQASYDSRSGRFCGRVVALSQREGQRWLPRGLFLRRY